MIDLNGILIPERQLAALHDEIDARTLSGAVSPLVDADVADHRSAYLHYLVLTHLRHRLPAHYQTEPLVVYNRYYWFLRFARLYCEQHGKDAGLEQQAFQILDAAMLEINWQIVEAIENCAKRDVK